MTRAPAEIDRLGPMTEDPSRTPPPLPAYQPPEQQTGLDAAERKRALERLAQKREFRTHLVIYWLVMTLLITIWLITTGPGSAFWPIWPMLGWGLGVAIHGVTVFSDREPTEDEIEAEAARLRARRARGHLED